MAGDPFKKGGATATAEKPAAKTGGGFDTTDADGEHVAGPPRSAAGGDPFSTSSGSSEYKVPDFLDRLVLVRPTELIPEMDTEIGQAENVIRGDVIVLDGDGEPAVGSITEDVLFFQIALKRTLKRVLEGPNPYQLGRLEMGKAGKGKSAPYIFSKPDDEDKELARQWIAANPLA